MRSPILWRVDKYIYHSAQAERYGINPKIVAKWKKRRSPSDAPTGPKEPCSTVLSKQEEAIVVTFQRHTFLPLDHCLYALQATFPHLTRSSLHRCFQRHGISRLPEVEGASRGEGTARRSRSTSSTSTSLRFAPRGKLHLFVAIDRLEENPERSRLDPFHHTSGPYI